MILMTFSMLDFWADEVEEGVRWLSMNVLFNCPV